jgi:hypothetical protein
MGLGIEIANGVGCPVSLGLFGGGMAMARSWRGIFGFVLRRRGEVRQSGTWVCFSGIGMELLRGVAFCCAVLGIYAGLAPRRRERVGSFCAGARDGALWHCLARVNGVES